MIQPFQCKVRSDIGNSHQDKNRLLLHEIVLKQAKIYFCIITSESVELLKCSANILELYFSEVKLPSASPLGYKELKGKELFKYVWQPCWKIIADSNKPFHEGEELRLLQPANDSNKYIFYLLYKVAVNKTLWERFLRLTNLGREEIPKRITAKMLQLELKGTISMLHFFV